MNLLTDNIKKIYFKYLIPSLGSAMVMSVYTMTDAVVIGKGVGANGLAALSITTPLLCILMSLGILLGVGGSVHMSIQKGRKNERKAFSYFTLSLIILSIFTAIIWLLYSLFMPELLKLMGANETLFPYAMDYMKYIIWFLPVAVFSNFLAIFVRCDGAPNRAMTGVICGGVFNIVFDIILVFPLNCGMGGAALASCIGMCIQIGISSSHFLSKKNTLKLVRPLNILRGTKDILAAGISSFLNEFANGIIVFLFNIQILKYCGTTSLSVYGVISNCVILFNSLFTGVGQSIQPVISYNYGAGKKERISHIKRLSFTTIIIMGIVFSLVGILFPTIVSAAFLPMNSDIEKISNYAIRMYFITFLPMGINVLTSYYLQSVLHSAESFIISILRNIVLSGLLIITLPIVLPSSILFITMPIVETICLILSITFIKKSSKLQI